MNATNISLNDINLADSATLDAIKFELNAEGQKTR